MRATLVLWIAILSALSANAGCGHLLQVEDSWKKQPHDTWFQRTKSPTLHRYPGPSRQLSDWWDRANLSTVVPLAKSLSPARFVDRMTNGRPALDINAFGQVPDSPWFQNRIGKRPMSIAELRRGPNRREGPSPGPLMVLSDKTEGVSPGFVVRDQAGVVWFVKFDPPAFAGLSTSAEWIASRLLYAAGYHVPEMFLVELDVTQLRLAKSATRRDRYNRLVTMQKKHLDRQLGLLNPGTSGKLRALVSRSVDGKAIGPFAFRGLHARDPNDRIPHERRRSLRGLWVFAAWLNNTDTRSQNTLDSFIPSPEDPALGHIRHYLIDFGDALGAAGNRPKNKKEGHVHTVDWAEMGRSLVSLGFYYPYWYPVRRSPFRAVGIFESEVFSPKRWRPSFPNPAFDEATPYDIFWAATILFRFRREHIEAVVQDAKYTEPGAADWVARVLMRRREKLLRYAFQRMLAVTDFRTADFDVSFTDMRPTSRGKNVHWTLKWNRVGRDRLLGKGVSHSSTISLAATFDGLAQVDQKRLVKKPFVTLTIWKMHGGRRGPHVRLHMRVVKQGLLPIALQREFR